MTQCGKGNDVVESGRHIEDTKLDGAKKRVRADIPPDFLAIVDAASINQCLHVLIEIFPGDERVWKPTAGKALPDHGAIRLESSEPPRPKWRVRGESKQMWYPCTRLIHQLDGNLIIFNCDVDMQSIDQDGTSNILKFFL